MLNWLKWLIARKELEELLRYRVASHEAWKWNVGVVPEAAETAHWITDVAKGSKSMNSQALRDHLLELKEKSLRQRNPHNDVNDC